MRRASVVSLVVAVFPLACSREGAKPSPAPAAAASPAATAEPGEPPEVDRVTPLPKPLPEVAARVNGQAIALKPVRILAEQAMRAGGAPAGEPFAYRQALQQVIIRELLFQEAVKRNLTADDARVDQAYNEARVRFKDDKAWAAMLAGEGMDPQSYRNELRIQHTIHKLLTHVADQARAQATDQEAMAFYESHPAVFDTGERMKVSHILVRVPPEAAGPRRDALRKKAEELLRRVRAGEDFAALARSSSEDPGSAERGGELQPFRRGEMVPPFEQAAFNLKPGEVSDIVESNFGFHIIKAKEKVAAKKLTFPEVKERLKLEMVQQKRQQAQQAFVNSLRAKAKIETYL